MRNNNEHTELSTYGKAYMDLDKSLKIVQNQNSSLEDVIKALKIGLNSHKICSDVLEKASVEISKIKETFES